MNSKQLQRQVHYMYKQTVCWLFVILLLLPYMPSRAETDGPSFSTTFDLTRINGNGNIFCQCSAEEFEESGFNIGNLVSVSFLGQTLDLPYCMNYTDVSVGQAGLFNRNGYLILAANMQNFASTYHIVSPDQNDDGSWNYAEGVSGPIQVSFRLKDVSGAPNEVVTGLSYTDKREDYPHLTDQQFANFRAVKTRGMGKNRLYRTASPLNPLHNRNTYAEAALKEAGVTLILNLADTESSLSQFEGYENSYYSSIKHKELGLSVDVTREDTRNKLADGFRFMAQNPGVYAINCLEGKERTGFAIAVLECLMGADYQEIIADYMETYYNYYGVTKEEDRYNTIAEMNIKKTLETIFKVNELRTADLKGEAEEYMRDGGLDEKTIEALKKNLSGQISIADAGISLSRQTFVYNGKVQKPSVKSVDGLALTAGKDYSISWSDISSKNAGTYRITITGKGQYTGQTQASYRILKAANPIKAKSKAVKVSFRKLKKQSIVKKWKSAFLVKKAKGKVIFRKKSGSKRIRIDKKSGKIIILKKTSKKLYKIKVTITAAGNKNYNKRSKTVLLKVKVK